MHKEAFGAIVQTNVKSITENFENIDAAVQVSVVHQVLGSSFSAIHWDLATQFFNKKRRGTVDPFHSGYIRHSYSYKIDKLHTFATRWEDFTVDPEVDKEIADGLLHREEAEKEYFEAFLQDKLVEDKIPFFEPFCKAKLITGNKKKKKFLKPF